jgi:hypothetical protein
LRKSDQESCTNYRASAIPTRAHGKKYAGGDFQVHMFWGIATVLTERSHGLKGPATRPANFMASGMLVHRAHLLRATLPMC